MTSAACNAHTLVYVSRARTCISAAEGALSGAAKETRVLRRSPARSVQNYKRTFSFRFTLKKALEFTFYFPQKRLRGSNYLRARTPPPCSMCVSPIQPLPQQTLPPPALRLLQSFHLPLLAFRAQQPLIRNPVQVHHLLVADTSVKRIKTGSRCFPPAHPKKTRLDRRTPHICTRSRCTTRCYSTRLSSWALLGHTAPFPCLHGHLFRQSTPSRSTYSLTLLLSFFRPTFVHVSFTLPFIYLFNSQKCPITNGALAICQPHRQTV